MKRYSSFSVILVIIVCALLLGSCSRVVTTAEVSSIQRASFSSALSVPEGGHDSTSFLVGEFTNDGGVLTRFNGLGEITIIRPDGQTSVGNYCLTEYKSQEAYVTIEMDGVSVDYTFNLASSTGDFTLTDEYGAAYTFTPVRY